MIWSQLCDIESSILNFITNISSSIGFTLLFSIGLAIEVLFVFFFVLKSLGAYEMRVTKSIEKLNLWLFQHKKLTEENIKEFNNLVKTKSPKRLNHYWQQFILFREGNPSTYMSAENVVDKPLKASGIDSNIRNLTLVSVIWAVLLFILGLAHSNTTASSLSIQSMMLSLILPFLVILLGGIFVIILRARKNVNLNTLYQNLSLFNRFLDNACVELPSYIDYQLLFTQQEIQKGIPVLREFLDARARQEKEAFEKERENKIESESYDFESCGVDGSGILDRAMEEATKFVNKQGKTLALIAQLESEIESRKKNYDNVAKDYHKKIQVSKENVDKLRQQQEETTNRIESNFIRKQQTQELAKQEQLEGELDQQTTRFLLEKNEFEEEIKRLRKELDDVKVGTSKAMTNEYQEFYNKICKSAQLAVELLVKNKFDFVTNEKEYTENVIVELNKKVKDLEADNVELKTRLGLPVDQPVDGHYDENGNYVYANGSFYDPEGNYHDAEGNVFSTDGQLIESAEDKPKEEKPVNFDEVEFYTDLDTKDDVINMANNIVENLKNGTQSDGVTPETEEPTQPENKGDESQFPRSGVVDSVVETQVQETSIIEEISEVEEVSEFEVQPVPETGTVPVVENEPVINEQVQEENKIDDATPPTTQTFNFDFDDNKEQTNLEEENVQNGFSFDNFDEDESDNEEFDDDDESESEVEDDDIDSDENEQDDIDDDDDDSDEIDDDDEDEEEISEREDQIESEVEESIVNTESETTNIQSEIEEDSENEVEEEVSEPEIESIPPVQNETVIEEQPEVQSEEENIQNGFNFDDFKNETDENGTEEESTEESEENNDIEENNIEEEQEENSEPEDKAKSKIEQLFASLAQQNNSVQNNFVQQEIEEDSKNEQESEEEIETEEETETENETEVEEIVSESEVELVSTVQNETIVEEQAEVQSEEETVQNGFGFDDFKNETDENESEEESTEESEENNDIEENNIEEEQKEQSEPEDKAKSKIEQLFASIAAQRNNPVQPETEEKSETEQELKEENEVETETENEVKEVVSIPEIQPEQEVQSDTKIEEPVVNLVQETVSVQSEPVVQTKLEEQSEQVIKEEQEPEVQSAPVIDIEKYANDPDSVVREYVEKIQIAKQLVDRFNQKIAKTNNRLDIEYIKMQQERELKKQTQLEEELLNYLANRGDVPTNRIEVREEVVKTQDTIPQQSFVQPQSQPQTSFVQSTPQQSQATVVQPVQQTQPVQQQPQIRINEVDEDYYDDNDDVDGEEEQDVARRPGRPKGTTKVEKPVPSGRKPGRPKGTTKVERPAPSSNGPGRPRKIDVEDPSPTDFEISSIEEQIARETSRVNQMRDNYNQEMETAINSLNKPEKKAENKNLDNEVSNIKKQASTVKKNKDLDGMDFMNKKLAALINQVKKEQKAQQLQQQQQQEDEDK